jgi:hypothetical protein
MDGDTPDPPSAAVDSVHNTVAALRAMKGYRACRGDVRQLRTDLAACDSNERSVSASIQKTRQVDQTPRVAASALPTP